MTVSDQITARKKRKALELLNRRRLDDARKAYQELLRRDPGDAESWRMLGIVAGRSGNAADAAQCMQKSLSADPDSARAWFGYGQILEMQGRINDAGKSYLKAVELDPILTEAHASLGALYLERSYFRHARYHFRRALDIDQFHPELMVAEGFNKTSLMTAYGEALRFCGEALEALEVFQSLLRERPDDPDLLYKIGSTYVQLAQVDDAYRSFHRGIEIAPRNVRLRTSEVKLLCLENRFDEALDKLRPLLDSAADNIDVALSHATLCHLSGDCDQAIDHLEKIVSAGKANPRKRAMACFELGRLYDAGKDYDRAFDWYRQGNDMKKGGYDRAAADAEVAAIIEGYDKETLATANRAHNSDQRPVFIVGMPRSGSSLVEQILASHPEVHGAGELAEIGFLIREYQRKRDDRGPERFKTECRSFTSDILDDMASRYLQRLASCSNGERYVTDKMPNNYYRLGPISLMFPRARIIHCRRNPVDTCLSCYFQNFAGFHPYSNDFESLAAFYRNYQRLMTHWKEVIALPILEVDYEALVADQEAETRRMLEFLDLEWDDHCLQHHKTRRATLTASYDQVNKPIYSSSVARWKRYERHIIPLIGLLDE